MVLSLFVKSSSNAPYVLCWCWKEEVFRILNESQHSKILHWIKLEKNTALAVTIAAWRTNKTKCFILILWFHDFQSITGSIIQKAVVHTLLLLIACSTPFVLCHSLLPFSSRVYQLSQWEKKNIISSGTISREREFAQIDKSTMCGLRVNMNNIPHIY